MRPINKDILKLAIPSILANITVPLVGMVDIAVAGHLDGTMTAGEMISAATMIGGIAIGSMLFDLLYWNFGFLRVGTGGLAAQAFGRNDRKECARILARALGIALGCALVLIAIQWIFLKASFLVVDCTPQVRELASTYFHIRIWAAPATLCLMAFKGWFIGMQDSVSPMITDFVVNGMNILMSIVLALGIAVGLSDAGLSGADISGIGLSGQDALHAGSEAVTADGLPSYGRHWLIRPMGFSGIAAGTVAAQYSGLLVALLLLLTKYFRTTLSALCPDDLRQLFRGAETRRFFVMNRDLFIRSLCFIAIYIGFTTISARYGDVLLAVSSILMKLLMIFSYFTDGFAYAGEALTGRYIGAKDGEGLRQTVKWTFVWSMAIAVIFMGVYHFAGTPMLRMMTSDAAVINQARTFMPWLLLMPVVGCAAFTWDGIYIGATASKAIRNAMLWAVIAFAGVWGLGMLGLDMFQPAAQSASQSASQPVTLPAASDSSARNILAMHILMAAYFAHLLARTIYLSAIYKTTFHVPEKRTVSSGTESQKFLI